MFLNSNESFEGLLLHSKEVPVHQKTFETIDDPDI